MLAAAVPDDVWFVFTFSRTHFHADTGLEAYVEVALAVLYQVLEGNGLVGLAPHPEPGLFIATISTQISVSG